MQPAAHPPTLPTPSPCPSRRRRRYVGLGCAPLIVNSVEYIGLVSVLDLVADLFVYAAFSNLMSEAERSLAITERLVAPVTDAIGQSSESLSMCSASAGVPLLTALEAFSQGVDSAPKGLHRAMVLGESDASGQLS